MDSGALQRSVLSTTLRAVVSPETWLAVVHLLAGFFVGTVSFTVALTGVVFGIGLLPLFLLGIPVLVGTLWAGDLTAQAERARFWLLLGAESAPPARPVSQPTGWRKLSMVLRRRSSWLHLGYALVRLPVSAIAATVVGLVWSTGVILLTLPAYNAQLPGGAAHLGDVTARNPVAVAG